MAEPNKKPVQCDTFSCMGRSVNRAEIPGCSTRVLADRKKDLSQTWPVYSKVLYDLHECDILYDHCLADFPPRPANIYILRIATTMRAYRAVSRTRRSQSDNDVPVISKDNFSWFG